MQEKSSRVQACVCERLPVGTVLGERNEHAEYVRHLRSAAVVREEAVSYSYSLDICPYTGVVWRSELGGDWRIAYPIYIRTDIVIPKLDFYTIATGRISIFSQKRKLTTLGTYMGPRPEWPQFPMRGLLYRAFNISDANNAFFGLDQRKFTAETVWLWIRLERPLRQPGSNARAILCSPVEAISHQVLTSGRVLQWNWFEFQIGEVTIESQLALSAEQFRDKFGFDKLQD